MHAVFPVCFTLLRCFYREGTEEYVWDHYQESVPMSTYLVAFVVSKFGNEKSPPTGNDVTFRIWARNSALDQIAYAKDIGAKILQYFETYYNVKYPLPKQVRTKIDRQITLFNFQGIIQKQMLFH